MSESQDKISVLILFKCSQSVDHSEDASLARPGQNSQIGASVAWKAEMYTDVYHDLISRLYGGVTAHAKANQFLEGLEVEPTQNQHQPRTNTSFTLVEKGY